MKTLIAYYTYSGNNGKLAQVLSEKLGCDTLEIRETKTKKIFSLMFEMFLGFTPKLAKYDVDLSGYDRVILAAPIWAGKYPAALNAFIKNEKDKLKDYSFVTICGGAVQKEKIIAALTKAVGYKPANVAEIGIAERVPEEMKKDIMHFKFDDSNIAYFERDIDNFAELMSK